ncbi:MAG: hypothetical protein WBZ48_00685 [Bacteroidota bacterium]
MNLPARIFLISAAAALTANAQDLQYRFSLIEEGTFSQLNLETPLNYHNLILPQATRGNDAISNLFLSYGGLSTSLNVGAVASNVAKPAYQSSIRELSYDLSLTDNFDITVGRKILKWGPGYAFNPTGVVEPQRSPSDPSDRLDQNVGRTLISLNAFFGKSSLTFVYLNDAQLQAGEFHWGEHDYAVRVYTFLNGLDLSGILHYRQGDRLEAGTNWSYVIGQNLEIHGEFLGKEGSSTMYHEILFSNSTEQIFSSDPYATPFDHSTEIFYKLLIGGQYTFENGLNIAIEYYRNEEGLTRSEWNQWMKFVKFQNSIQRGLIPEPAEMIGPSRYNLLWALQTLSPRGTMRDYVFGREYYSTDSWIIEFIQLMNADDASIVLVPTVSYQTSEFLTLYVRLAFFVGDSDSEYGALFTRYSTNLGIQFQL